MTKKDAYIKKMKAKLDEWSAEIDKLQAKAKQAEAGLQLEYQDEINQVKTLKMAAQKKLTELKDTGDSVWEELRTGVDAAWKELENAISKVQSKIQ